MRKYLLKDLQHLAIIGCLGVLGDDGGSRQVKQVVSVHPAVWQSRRRLGLGLPSWRTSPDVLISVNTCVTQNTELVRVKQDFKA